MAKNNNLTDFLNDLADGIRKAETGSTSGSDIPAQNFRARVEALKLSTQTADADAVAGDILKDKTAYVDGKKVTGTMPTPTRGTTSITVAADDTNDKLTITASNKQPKGYNSDANAKTATTTVTLTASGRTVTATATNGTKVSKDVDTVDRADTTLTSSKDATNSALVFTASNDQDTGYVTGANKTARKTVILSTSGATVTATDGTNSISTTIPSGSVSASAIASATTFVDPGDISIETNTNAVSGKTRVNITPTTDTSDISTYYAAVKAIAAANTTGETSNISGTAMVGVDAGYISSGATGPVTGTARAKTNEKESSVYYLPIPTGSASTPATSISVTPSISIDSAGKITASGGKSTSVTPSVSEGYVANGTAGTVSVSVSNTKQLTTKGTTTITPSTSAQTAVEAGVYTTGKITVGAIPDSYVKPSGNIDITSAGVHNVSGKATATVAAGEVTASGTASATTFVDPGDISIETSTNAVSGKTRVNLTPTTSTSGISTYYAAVKAIAAANDTGATSAISGTATAGVSPGYVSSGATGSVTGTATAKANEAESSVYYLPIPTGSAKTPTTTITATVGAPSYNSSTGKYNISVSGSKSITPIVSEGYISSGTPGTVSVSGSTSINAGSCSVSGGGLSGGGSVTPTVTLSSGNDTTMSNITIGGKDTTNYPYYFKINSSSSSGSSTVSRAAVTDTHEAGYISDQPAKEVIGADSKTVTVNAGSGSTYVNIKTAKLRAYGGATAHIDTEPGAISIANKSASVSGKTQITASPSTSTSGISKYYVAVNATAAENSASGNIGGTAYADVTSAGYAGGPVAGTGSISGTATVDISEKTSSTYYIPIASGSATTPTTSILATPSISVDNDGIVTAIAQGSDSITPDVTAGYISSGTAGTISVDSRNSYNLPTVTPGYEFYKTNDGKIGAVWTCTTPGWAKTGSYSSTVNPTTLDSNLKPENIANGIKIFGVTGTHAQFNSTTLKVTPTLNAQVFHAADDGYQGYYEVTVDGMPNGALKTPTGSITNSTGKVSISSGVSTSGYIGTNSTKSGSLQLTTQAAQTITPGTTNKTISAYRWLTGTQTIKGDSNLVAGNIKSGTTIFGVTGTYTGSGSTGGVRTGSLTIENSGGTILHAVVPTYDGTYYTGMQDVDISAGSSYDFTNVIIGAPIVCYVLGEYGFYNPSYLSTSSGTIYINSTDTYRASDDLDDESAYQRLTIFKFHMSSSSASVYVWHDCCFDGDSDILMADGTTKALRNVEINDEVMTYNETNGLIEGNKVTSLGTVKLTRALEIVLEDDTVIRMNAYHPMWTQDGWKSWLGHKDLPKLTLEDKLLNSVGEYIAIKSMETVQIDKQTYYTLKVANNNNFYVNGYLAQGKDKD